jgi:uroporphyrinogen III methyltransferase/synthase
LLGQVVLVTRPGSRGAALAGRLRDLGARAEQRPTIALQPVQDDSEARHALEGLAEYDWVLFTSSNGVRYFFDLLAESGGTAPGDLPRLASIGPATSRALSERGVSPEVEAGDSRAEGLAAALRRVARSGERALLVRPEAARETLPRLLREHGVRVDPVPFYRNVPAPGLDRVARELIDGRYSAVVLSAPSTLAHLLVEGDRRGPELRAALADTALVAIGEVTAAAVRDAGLPLAAVALEPSDDGIAAALCRACGERSG